MGLNESDQFMLFPCPRLYSGPRKASIFQRAIAIILLTNTKGGILAMARNVTSGTINGMYPGATHSAACLGLVRSTRDSHGSTGDSHFSQLSLVAYQVVMVSHKISKEKPAELHQAGFSFIKRLVLFREIQPTIVKLNLSSFPNVLPFCFSRPSYCPLYLGQHVPPASREYPVCVYRQ